MASIFIYKIDNQNLSILKTTNNLTSIFFIINNESLFF